MKKILFQYKLDKVLDEVIGYDTTLYHKMGRKAIKEWGFAKK